MSNHVHAEGHETELVALARAQELVGTPANSRMSKNVRLVELRDGRPALAINQLSLPPHNMPAEEFYFGAVKMRGSLITIIGACQQQQAGTWLYALVDYIDTSRYLTLLPDFTIDPGPELFTDTLLRALAGRDVRRIRQCPECPRLFVAVPEFKITCSLRCSRLHRSHKFITEHPGYYARSERERRIKQRKGETVEQRKLAAGQHKARQPHR